MDFGLFKEIINEASKYGKRSFSLHLFGEPLLYPYWYEAIRYIKSKHKNHTVLFTTNGTLIGKDDILDKLIGSGADQVLWSWRKEAKFSEETKRKLKKWGRFRVRFIKEVTTPEALREWKDWKNTESRRLHNYGGKINLENYGSIVSNQKRWPCYHLWLSPAVSWDGKILICCADPHKKEVLGQFPEQSVAQCWNGEQIKAIRTSHLKGEYVGICKNCDVWKSTPSLF